MNRLSSMSFRLSCIAIVIAFFNPRMHAETWTCSTVNAVTGENCVKLTKSYDYNLTNHWWCYYFSNSCGRALGLDIFL
jgi:hypothetical protein